MPRLENDTAVHAALSAFKRRTSLAKAIDGGEAQALIDALNKFTNGDENRTVAIFKAIVAQFGPGFSSAPFDPKDFDPRNDYRPNSGGFSDAALQKATDPRTGRVDVRYAEAIDGFEELARSLLAKARHYNGFGAHAPGSTPLTPSVTQDIGFLDPSTPVRKSGKKIYTSASDLGRDAEDEA